MKNSQGSHIDSETNIRQHSETNKYVNQRQTVNIPQPIGQHVFNQIVPMSEVLRSQGFPPPTLQYARPPTAIFQPVLQPSVLQPMVVPDVQQPQSHSSSLHQYGPVRSTQPNEGEQGHRDIRGEQTLLKEPCSTEWVKGRNDGAGPVIESTPDPSTSKESEVEVQCEGSTTVSNSTREKNGSITTYTVDSTIDATAISKSQNSDLYWGRQEVRHPLLQQRVSKVIHELRRLIFAAWI